MKFTRARFRILVPVHAPLFTRTFFTAIFFTANLLTASAVHAQEDGAHIKAALPRLEQFAKDALKESGVPGLAVAVVYKDEVVYLQGFGVRKAGGDEPVTADTVFQLASASKPIASTIVAALVGDKVVSWDTPVQSIDPEFQLSDPWITSQVTLRDLFAHRSGLYGDAGNDLEQLGFERATILARLRYLNPGGPFRASYAYSNFGMTAGGIAAAKAAGKSWEEVAKMRLYKPLGMAHTSSSYQDFIAESNRASLHILVDGAWTPKLTRNAEAQSPAGGVSSSARDMAQWLRLQLGNGSFEGKQLVGKDALEETHQPLILRGPNPITGRPSFYGLGWSVDYDTAGRLRLSHAGAFSVGARTYVGLIPSEDLGVVVLTNAFPTGVPEAIADTFFDTVLEGKPQRDWLKTWDGLYNALTEGFSSAAAAYQTPPKQPSPALPLSAYVGSYANAYVGNIEVVAKDGALQLIMGPQRMAFALEPYARDLFLYYPYEELPAVPSPVTFSIGAQQQATQLVIDDLNGVGQGVFSRVP